MMSHRGSIANSILPVYFIDQHFELNLFSARLQDERNKPLGSQRNGQMETSVEHQIQYFQVTIDIGLVVSNLE